MLGRTNSELPGNDGVGPDVLVGLFVERSQEAVIGILGI